MHSEATNSLRGLPDGKLISALGFGCAALWGKRGFPAERAARILGTAVANGINHFDTAPSYADSETRLGAFLAERDLDKLVISTKVGTEHGSLRRSFDPKRMRESFHGSLRRLGVDSVDILYLHGPRFSDLTPEVWEFFERLKQEGKIRYAGVNSFDLGVVEACLMQPSLNAIMLQYSIADRRFDTLIRQLAGAGKIVVAGTIMAQGIFNLKSFVPINKGRAWYLLRALKNDALFPFRGWRLGRRLAKTGLNPYAAAVRFAVSNRYITSSLFGTASPTHVAFNADASREPLSDAQYVALFGAKEPVS